MWLFPPFFSFTFIERISCTSLQVDLTAKLINSPLSNLTVAHYYLLSACVRSHGDYLSLCYASKRLLHICVYAWICGWWITPSDPCHHHKNSCLKRFSSTASIVSINMTTAKQGFMFFSNELHWCFQRQSNYNVEETIQQYSDQLM